MPVMEGKCALFKAFGDVDAFPLCIRSKDVDEIVNTVALLAGSFGGIAHLLHLPLHMVPGVAGVGERLRHDGVQDDVGLCDGILGAHHTELEFITGKCKGGSPIPVRRILHKIRQRLHARFQFFPMEGMGRGAGCNDLRHHIRQLLSQKCR